MGTNKNILKALSFGLGLELGLAGGIVLAQALAQRRRSYTGSDRQVAPVWRIMRLVNQRVISMYQASGQGEELILLLTTTGRKSGQPHTTPLQYESFDGVFYVTAARGPQADWFKNIVARPQVEIQVGQQHFTGLAEPITDPARITAFLELRMRRRPAMIRALLMTHGLPPQPSHAQLEQLAAHLAMAAIYPELA